MLSRIDYVLVHKASLDKFKKVEIILGLPWQSSVKTLPSMERVKIWSLVRELSRFSRVRLCATPQMAAHQAPPSLGFSRQEHWSGLPFPSPMHESEKWKWSCSVESDSSRPHGLQPTRLLHPTCLRAKNQKVKQKQHCNKFNTDFYQKKKKERNHMKHLFWSQRYEITNTL